MPAVVTSEATLDSKTVTVAPLVLLSVVDHYDRLVNTNSESAFSNNGNKRVLGVILGDNYTSKHSIKVTNSFAIPFEEDEKDPDIWFLDHNFIESMLEMFKKINAKEKLIGWYHSGPKLRSSDLKINEAFKKFTQNPLLLIVDINSRDPIDIPTDSYMAVEEIKDDGSAAEKTFLHLPSIIKAEEAEEIGVEHLLRDIRDQASGSLSIKLTNNFKSLKSLNERLTNIISYLNKILDDELPVKNVILAKLQDIFNLLPSFAGLLDDNKAKEVTGHSQALAKAFTVKTNDELMMVYISSLVRSIIAFHDMIENKLENKKLEQKKDQTVEEADQEEADKEAAKDADDDVDMKK